jgi:predicted house-cleaning noncanonical NTP pyrophosphatase (MazG superfamily)
MVVRSKRKNIMDVEFVNAYIEKLLNEVMELTKTKMLLETQLVIASKTVTSLKSENEKLQNSLNKKSSKTKEENSF